MVILVFYRENMPQNTFFRQNGNRIFWGVNKTACYGFSTYFYIENHIQRLCYQDSDKSLLPPRVNLTGGSHLGFPTLQCPMYMILPHIRQTYLDS